MLLSTGAVSVSMPSSTASAKPKRYHLVLVALHWIVVVLIFATAFLATGGEEGRRGGATIAGIPVLGVHMILGITVLVLMIVRLVIRWRTQRPDWATTGSGLLDKFGELTHWALYFFTFAITITGLILAMQGNRLARTFGLASSRPPQFAQGQFQPGQFPPPGGGEGGEGGFEGGFGRGNLFTQLGRFHGISWAFLFLLVLLHVGAALYHQFIVKDNLFGRMWFGRQTE